MFGLLNEWFVWVIFLILVLLWIVQFVQLMLLSDADFPGRLDKALWAAAFILVFFMAPFAFIFWKRSYVEMRHMQRSPADS